MIIDDTKKQRGLPKRYSPPPVPAERQTKALTAITDAIGQLTATVEKLDGIAIGDELQGSLGEIAATLKSIDEGLRALAEPKQGGEWVHHVERNREHQITTIRSVKG